MNRWCKLMGMYCPMATTNGYCQVTACKHMAEPMPICNNENAVMPYETPKVNWTVDDYIPIEWLKKWAETNSNGEWSVEYRTVFNGILKDWEKENEID